MLLSQVELLALARKQLQSVRTAFCHWHLVMARCDSSLIVTSQIEGVPEAYLQELKKHISLWPDKTDVGFLTLFFLVFRAGFD